MLRLPGNHMCCLSLAKFLSSSDASKFLAHPWHLLVKVSAHLNACLGQSGCVLWLVVRMGRQGRAVWWGGWCYTHELVIAPPTASTPMGKGVTSKNSYSCACETFTVRIAPCTAAPYLLLHQGGWACSAPCRENSGSWIGFLGFGSSLPHELAHG